MAEQKKQTSKRSRRSKCQLYASRKIRERNKARRIRRHLRRLELRRKKRHQIREDTVALEALKRYA